MYSLRTSKKRALKVTQENAAYKSSIYAEYFRHLALTSDTHGVDKLAKPHEIVVSLTSYPARINDVALTIESLFQQSLKANRIVLWLSRDNFPDQYESLPNILRKQCDRGLEVVFVEGDIGCYKKIIYAIERFTDSLILTVDDDVLYPVDLIDRLYRDYLSEPDVVHCHRGHLMRFNYFGRIKPYTSWPKSVQTPEACLNIFPTGMGGVLYFPGCFHPDVTDIDLFMKLAPSADDVWLKAMTLLQSVKCKVSHNDRPWKTRFLTIQGSQGRALKSINRSKGTGNDSKIRSVLTHYGLWDELHTKMKGLENNG